MNGLSGNKINNDDNINYNNSNNSYNNNSENIKNKNTISIIITQATVN